MLFLRLVLCLAFIIAIQATPKNTRPKRDIHFIKKILKNAVFGSENKTVERPKFLIKDALGNYKIVNIPKGYKAIYIKRVPEGVVQHEVPKSEIGVLETYLGTKSTMDSLAALEDVKKLIETGIISRKDNIEDINQDPRISYEENRDKDVYANTIHTPYIPISLNELSSADSNVYHSPNKPIIGEHSEGSLNKIYTPNEPLTINEQEEFYSNIQHVPHISGSKEFSDTLSSTKADVPFFIPFTAGPPRTSYDTSLTDTIAISLDPKVVYHGYKPVITFIPNRKYSYKQIYNDGSGIHYYVNGKKEVIPKVVKNVQALTPPKFIIEPLHKIPGVPTATPEQKRFIYRLIKHYNNTMREEMIEEPSGVKVSEHTVLDKNNVEHVPVKFLHPTSFVVPKPALPHYEIVHNAPFSHRYSYVQTNFPTNPQVLINSQKFPVIRETEFKPAQHPIHVAFSLPLPNSNVQFVPENSGTKSNTQHFVQSLPVEHNKEYVSSYPRTFIAPINNPTFSHRYSYVQTNLPNPSLTIIPQEVPVIKETQFKPTKATNQYSSTIVKLPKPNELFKPESNLNFVKLVSKDNYNQQNNQNLDTNQYSYTQTHSNGNNVIYKDHEVFISNSNTKSLPTINELFPPENTVQFPSEISNQSTTERIQNRLSETSTSTPIETTTKVTESIKAINKNVKDNQPKRRKIYGRVKLRRNETKVYGNKIEVSEAPLSVNPIVVPESQGQFSYKQINDDGSSSTISVKGDHKSVEIDIGKDSIDTQRGDVP